MAEADPLVNHTFIQATMARGYMAHTEAKDLFQSLAGSSPGSPGSPFWHALSACLACAKQLCNAGFGFGEFLAALNLSLEFLQLQLRQIKSPVRILVCVWNDDG